MSQNQNIFIRQVGDIFGLREESVSLVYAPLAGICFLADAADSRALSLGLKTDGAEYGSSSRSDSSWQDILGRLTVQTGAVLRVPPSPYDLVEIDLLLNNTCNFSCSYCYSAAGRTHQHISFETVASLVDFLFSETREKKRPLKINFSGGGEPLLDFPLIRRTVDYIADCARKNPRPYRLGLVTNGSLITSEIAEFVSLHNIQLVVSFEVMQEFQDAERGQYERVASSIDLLLDHSTPFGIRTTVTPMTVNRLVEIVEELDRRFPELKAITFDTVLASALFPSPADMDVYHDAFFDNYLQARERGLQLGIHVGCLSFSQTDFLRERRCIGKIVLTPSGAISPCARISSPKEPLYRDFIYGEVCADGHVYMDEEHYFRLMKHDIHTQSECTSCFARWNCGGGCYLFDRSFDAEYKSSYCRFTRSCLQWELLDKLDGQHRQSFGSSLRDHLVSQLS